MAFLAAPPAVLVAAVFLLGLCVGSFLNVVILRLPRMMEREWRAQCAELASDAGITHAGERFDLVWPPSHCPRCERRIRARENIPLLSWLLLRGRCRGCHARISPRYPLVELATGGLSAAVIWHFGPTTAGLGALIVTWALVALTGIDLDEQLLPDSITLPLLWLGLLFSLGGVFVDPVTAIIGAAAGYLALWSVYQLFRLATGKEGMGYGDFKLLAMLGAWLGWQVLPVIVVLSSVVGAVVGVAMITGLGRGREQPIPFGPYLAAAGWIAMLWGDTIIGGYLRFAGLH